MPDRAEIFKRCPIHRCWSYVVSFEISNGSINVLIGFQTSDFNILLTNSDLKFYALSGYIDDFDIHELEFVRVYFYRECWKELCTPRKTDRGAFPVFAGVVSSL